MRIINYYKREELHKLAVKSIIDRNVKLIEIEKHKYFEFAEIGNGRYANYNMSMNLNV